MKDSFGRKIDYIRLSVSDRCNLRCIYCHNGDFEKVSSEAIISYEEIIAVVSYLQKRGLEAVKITGGEPLLRRNINYCIEKLVELGTEVSLTTNGVFLAEKAQNLYNAGLRRVNIGLDCLNKDLFSKMTGSLEYERVIEGIDKALEVGFDPVKVNVVLIKRLNEEIQPWLKLAAEKEVYVRFIEVMPFVDGYQPVKNDEILKSLMRTGNVEKTTVKGSGPAKYLKVEGIKKPIGFISPISESFCSQCSRLRLNSQGHIRSCLYSSKTYNVKNIFRNGFSEDKLAHLIDQVLANKPADKQGLSPTENMCQIGG